MRLVDLSVGLFNKMSTHRNSPKPVILPYATHEESAKRLSHGHSIAIHYMAMLDHSGTHVDAYSHLSVKGATVDEMALEEFYGPAVCWDFTHIPRRAPSTWRT